MCTGRLECYTHVLDVANACVLCRRLTAAKAYLHALGCLSSRRRPITSRRLACGVDMARGFPSASSGLRQESAR